MVEKLHERVIIFAKLIFFLKKQMKKLPSAPLCYVFSKVIKLAGTGDSKCISFPVTG